MKQQDLNATTRTPDAVPTELILQELSQSIHATVNKQYEVLNHAILPELQAQGIQFLQYQDLLENIRPGLQPFAKEVQPVLTPISLDPSHPFPRLVNKSLNFIISLKVKMPLAVKSRWQLCRHHVPYPA